MTADLVVARGGLKGTVLIAERMSHGDAKRSPWVTMTPKNASTFYVGCAYTVSRLSPRRRVMQTVTVDLFKEWLAGRLGTRQQTDGFVSDACQRAIVDGRLNMYPQRSLSSGNHAKPRPRRWGSKHSLGCPIWDLIRLMIAKGVIPTVDGVVELSATATTRIDRSLMWPALVPHGASPHWGGSFRKAFGRLATHMHIRSKRNHLPGCNTSDTYSYVFPSIPELRHRYRLIHGVDPFLQHEAVEQRKGFDHDPTDGMMPASNVLDDLKHIAMQFEPVTADPTKPSLRPYVKTHPKWQRPGNEAVV
jgi:hypothetical protein